MRSSSLQLWIYNSDQEPIANQESISNQADIGHAVVAALSEMPSLQALSLRLGNNDSLTSKIRTAFRTSKTILAPIKALEVMEVPNAAFLLRACPSLDTFITNFPNKQHKKTFKALAGMSNVRRVQVENRKGWKTGHFQGEINNSNVKLFGYEVTILSRPVSIYTHHSGVMSQRWHLQKQAYGENDKL